MTDIPTTEPTEIRAGDTVQWYKSLSDYPANDGWVLDYKLHSENQSHSISTSASGSDHLATITAATSATYLFGDYTIIGWVTKASERYTLPVKKVTIKPNLAALTTGYDGRSTAKKTLDLLNAALESQGNNAWVQSYTIAGRTMQFRSISDFFAFRSKVQAEVNREEKADRLKAGLAAKNKISVRL